jgi:hypothetical protein
MYQAYAASPPRLAASPPRQVGASPPRRLPSPSRRRASPGRCPALRSLARALEAPLTSPHLAPVSSEYLTSTHLTSPQRSNSRSTRCSTQLTAPRRSPHLSSQLFSDTIHVRSPHLTAPLRLPRPSALLTSPLADFPLSTLATICHPAQTFAALYWTARPDPAVGPDGSSPRPRLMECGKGFSMFCSDFCVNLTQHH